MSTTSLVEALGRYPPAKIAKAPTVATVKSSRAWERLATS
jgi:hypothetical protein